MADQATQNETHPYDLFQIGDQIKHPKWGVGTILFRSGGGEETKAIVVFPEEGQKKLALKYAKIKKVQATRSKADKAAEVAKSKKNGGGDEFSEELEKLDALDKNDEKIPATEEEKEETSFDEDDTKGIETIAKGKDSPGE